MALPLAPARTHTRVRARASSGETGKAKQPFHESQHMRTHLRWSKRDDWLWRSGEVTRAGAQAALPQTKYFLQQVHISNAP